MSDVDRAKADAVRQAVAALNQALADAAVRGLDVELDIERLGFIGAPVTQLVVQSKVSKLL